MTREEAIDYIEKWKTDYSVDAKDREVLSMALKALEQKNYKSEARRWKRRYLDLKQRIFKLEEQTRWIPVSEALPSRDVNVLAYHRNESFDYQYVSWIDEYSGKWAGFIGNLPDEVLAWMPLPEPYKAESEDKGVLEKINEKQDSLKAVCKAWDEAIEKNGYVN